MNSGTDNVEPSSKDNLISSLREVIANHEKRVAEDRCNFKELHREIDNLKSLRDSMQAEVDKAEAQIRKISLENVSIRLLLREAKNFVHNPQIKLDIEDELAKKGSL